MSSAIASTSHYHHHAHNLRHLCDLFVCCSVPTGLAAECYVAVGPTLLTPFALLPNHRSAITPISPAAIMPAATRTLYHMPHPLVHPAFTRGSPLGCNVAVCIVQRCLLRRCNHSLRHHAHFYHPNSRVAATYATPVVSCSKHSCHHSFYETVSSNLYVGPAE
jgi:hypothetical protein